MPVARYLSHPQVEIDADKDVRRWSLNEVGRARVGEIARNTGVLSGTTRVISSDETKAVETASPLAKALGLKVEIQPEMHENDRSATGFLPPDEFEQVADQFFANPNRSIRGWERAVDAQARILRSVSACLSQPATGDVLFVGHGGVGTLLYCALAGVRIDRCHDQGPGGGGNWFAFDLVQLRPMQSWRPMEELGRPD